MNRRNFLTSALAAVAASPALARLAPKALGGVRDDEPKPNVPAEPHEIDAEAQRAINEEVTKAIHRLQADPPRLRLPADGVTDPQEQWRTLAREWPAVATFSTTGVTVTTTSPYYSTTDPDFHWRVV